MDKITFENFKEVLCKSLSDAYCVDELNESTNLGELKIDSLDMMQIIFDIETNFKIKVDDSVFKELTPNITLKDLYENILKFQMV